jgi:RNA polymerase sigma factor (sigma-70 family)
VAESVFGEEAASDRELVGRFLARRDEGAFRALYDRHAAVLYRIAWRTLGGAGADAEDAVQECWVRATRGLEAFRWESALRTWLVGILLNCCRERRRGWRAAMTAVEVDAAAEPVPRWTDRLALERAIASLAPTPREVLLLHDVEGFTHAEIGSLLGMPAGTSKSHLHRARAALVARLGRAGS